MELDATYSRYKVMTFLSLSPRFFQSPYATLNGIRATECGRSPPAHHYPKKQVRTFDEREHLCHRIQIFYERWDDLHKCIHPIADLLRNLSRCIQQRHRRFGQFVDTAYRPGERVRISTPSSKSAFNGRHVLRAASGRGEEKDSIANTTTYNSCSEPFPLLPGVVHDKQTPKLPLCD